jgi:hypothetical protein
MKNIRQHMEELWESTARPHWCTQAVTMVSHCLQSMLGLVWYTDSAE